MSTPLGSAYGKIVIDSSGVTTGINTALSGLQRLESQVTTIGRNVSRVGDQLIQNLTLPIVGVGVASGKMAMDFEESMQHIVGLVGVSQDQVNAWTADLQKMGPAVGKGPKELAEALYFVTSSGLEGAQALDAVEQSARAASAGLGSTAVVADAVTSAMNAYRTAGLTAAQATDILVATVREGKGEADTIAPALGRVIPIAAQLGIRFDEVGAALAGMTLVGFDAAEASTNLSGIMSALLKPSKQAADVMAEFGLSGEMLRQTLKEKGLLGVLELLRDTIGEDDEALAKIFPNIRGFRGMLSLVGTNAEQVSGIFARMADTTGDADKAFAAAAQTAKYKFNAALAEGQTGLIKLGNAVLPAVIPVLQELAATLGRVADWFSKLPASTQETIVKILARVAALGPVLAIGGRLLTTIGSLMGVFNGLAKFVLGAVVNFGKLVTTGGEVIGFLAEAGVYGLAAVGAIAALAASIVILIKFLDAASRAAHATNAELIAMANSNTGNVIEDTFTRAGASFELMVNGSQRLRDVFIAHQEDMRKKLLAGEITLAEYNAEIERSAKVAGVWSTQFVVGTGNVTKIDKSVKILTASDVRLEEAMRDATIADEALAASLTVTSDGMGNLTNATDPATQAALDFAESQKIAAADVEAGTAMLDNLRTLIDGEVGPAYDDFIGQNDDLKAKISELVVEQEKLLGTQGRAVTSTNKNTLTANELTEAQAKQANVLAILTAAQRKKNESDTAFTARMAGLQVQYDNLTAKIGGAETATTSYVDNSKRLGEISTELDGLNQALDENANAYDERLKRILFDMVAEQLAVDGMTTAEAGALLKLAEKYGLIDRDTAAMQRDVLAATEQLAKDKNMDVFVDNLVGALDRAKTRAAETPADIVGPIGTAYAEAARIAGEKAGEVVTATTTMATGIGTQTDAAKTAFGTMTAGFVTDSGTVTTTIQGVDTSVKTALGGMRDSLHTYGPGIGSPLLTGFQTMSSGVIDVLNDVLSKISEVISAMLGIRAPNIQLPGGSGGGGGTSPTPSPSPSPSPAPSPSPTPTCFTGDTLITLADGTQIPIEQVRIGDRVLTFDPGTAEFSAGEVTDTLAHVVDGYLHVRTSSGLTLKVTGEHPFYLPRRHADTPTVHGEFVRARDLMAGDQLVSHTGTEIIEQVIALTDSGITVYNLNVDPHHTYVAGGVIVHNLKIDRALGGRFVIQTPNLPTLAARQAVSPAAHAQSGGAAGAVMYDGRTYYNTFQDTLTTKMYLEDQRRSKLRRIADTM